MNSVDEFLDRQKVKDERTSIFVMNGDVDHLRNLVDKAEAVDHDETAAILSKDSLTNESIGSLYLLGAEVDASDHELIIDDIYRIPHPRLESVISSMEAAISIKDIERVAWLSHRCYRYDELRKLFLLAGRENAERDLLSVSMKVYDCTPIDWALSKVLDPEGYRTRKWRI